MTRTQSLDGRRMSMQGTPADDGDGAKLDYTVSGFQVFQGE
jgi:hypothetical protein